MQLVFWKVLKSIYHGCHLEPFLMEYDKGVKGVRDNLAAESDAVTGYAVSWPCSTVACLRQPQGFLCSCLWWVSLRMLVSGQKKGRLVDAHNIGAGI